MTNFNQSRVKMFRRCQKQYSFRYDYPRYFGGKAKQEMVPKVSKLPLYRGTWMHALQEALHHQWAGAIPYTAVIGEGRNALRIEVETWEDVHAGLTSAFNNLFEEEKEDLADLPTECERMMKSYLRFWKDDRDRYSVVNVNGKPGIEFIVQVPLDKFGLKGHHFKGKVDLLVQDEEYDGIWIWDAKWMKSIPAPDERMMSPQAYLYVWGLRQAELDVRGFVYNYARTKAPTVPRVLKRPAGMLSLASKMDTDFYTYVVAIKQNHGEHWKSFIPYYKEKLKSLKGREAMWFDRGRIPVEDDKLLRSVREYTATVNDIRRRESRRDYVPRSYFYNCKFSCEFHGLCCAEFGGIDISPLINNRFQFVGERYDKEGDLLNA